MRGFNLKNLSKRLKHGSVAMFFLFANVGAVAVPFLPAQTAEAAPTCINDTAGANDVSGQKDLTKLCVDYAGAPNTVATTWNWDQTGTNGSNTMDACNLFDTDGDGNINFAVCVTTNSDPAVLQATTTYSCGDDKIDRCTSTQAVVSSGTTTCSVSQQNTDPFPTGTSSPKDTQGSCTIQLSTVGGASAKLIDVCSYPSSQPNSSPSDCVIARDNAGKIEVVKNLIPNNNAGLFNLQIDTVTKAANVGHNGTTGELVYAAGNRTIGETAGTSTNLANYTTSIVCKNLNGTGTIVAQATSTSVTLPLVDGADVVCTITNTTSSSITIIKDAKPNDAQDFSFTASGTGVGNFSLDDDTNATLPDTKVFNNLGAGSYSFTEASTTGWDFKDIVCTGGSVQITGATANVTLTAGQNVVCTYTNLKRGTITVNKVTNPANDPTSFSVNASGTGSIAGNATRSITTTTPAVYDVAQGTYGVAETVPQGWSETSNTCSNLTINATNLSASCTITNTKLGSLTIVKDSLPNDEQDFNFNVTNLPGGTFTLDDDSNVTLTNQKVFSGLLPGQYSVAEVSTPGWQLTGLTCNNSPIEGSTASVTLIAGQNVTCTFTNTKLGSISGIKYTSDVDSSLGSVLGGWTIYIDSNNNGQLDQGETSDVTDQAGAYSFGNLLPDTYVLLEVLMAGWTQIFGPAAVELNAGQTSTGNNFGNFENGSINGFKWNDKNADGVLGEGEEKLSGWTITLYDDQEKVLNSVQTSLSGVYEFTNLVPGTYSVCETLQTNWVQTYPANNGCHTIVINQSGESNQANFGNQGRGSIKVIKNVDTDGDGKVDISDATDWTWDINGKGDFATGSSSAQNVAAGNYTVSEDQKANYHVTASSCSGETSPEQPTTSLGVTVGVGETVTCSFTNTRDTGTITVNKIVSPSEDSGKFNLQINGTTYAANVSDGGTTGSVQIPTGNYVVAETAGTETSLSDYSSSYVCDNNLEANGTTTEEFSIDRDQNITCTFTNVRYGKIVVTKQTLPDGDKQSFSFEADYDQDGFSLSDGQSNSSGNLLPGTYSVSENLLEGWDLISTTCDGENEPDIINLKAGETVNCTFNNTQRGSISGVKYEVNADDTAGTEGNELEGWTIVIYNDNDDEDTDLDNLVTTKDTDSNGAYNFGNLVPDTYLVCETLKDNWTQIFPDGKPGCYTIELGAGENATGNDFGNFKNGSISGYKFNDLNGNGTDNEEPLLAGWEITLYQGQDKVDQTETDENGAYGFDDLGPGTYVVCETEQDGWQQITPDPSVNNGCYEITINESGESNQAVFGNQGRGSITVIKNVDNDGDGKVDVSDSSDWTWSLESDYYKDNGVTTGTTKDNLPAAEYTISEDQQRNFHFVSVTCGETKITQAETFTIELTPGANIVCTFTNARDTAKIKVNKSLAPRDDEGRFNLLIGDTEYATDIGDGGTTGWVTVPTGTYDISETSSEGTSLNDYVSTYNCGQGTSGEGTTVEDLVLSNDNNEVTCTFYNQRKSEVIVIKYNDINRNGSFDEDEETLPDWDFSLVSKTTCEPNYEEVFGFLSRVSLPEEECLQPEPDYAKTQTTNQDGSTTFSQIVPDRTYELTETQKEGWYLSNIFCYGDNNYLGYPVGDNYYIAPQAGETIRCEVGNYRAADLQISKQNDQDDAVLTGTTVTYTLVVSLPEDSGAVFDAVVRDILPDGFSYVAGSWTSTSSVTTDPLFDPIGEWQIGDLYPGDSVTLTYKATIDDSVAPGTYTNIAYSEGCAVDTGVIYDEYLLIERERIDEPEQNEEYECPELVKTDFVNSDVTVYKPKVLAATKTVLVNTGSSDVIRNAVIGLSIVTMTIALAVATRNQQKETK